MPRLGALFLREAWRVLSQQIYREIINKKIIFHAKQTPNTLIIKIIKPE
jgi:hypothetical protein